MLVFISSGTTGLAPFWGLSRLSLWEEKQGLEWGLKGHHLQVPNLTPFRGKLSSHYRVEKVDWIGIRACNQLMVAIRCAQYSNCCGVPTAGIGGEYLSDLINKIKIELQFIEIICAQMYNLILQFISSARLSTPSNDFNKLWNRCSFYIFLHFISETYIQILNIYINIQISFSLLTIYKTYSSVF